MSEPKFTPGPWRWEEPDYEKEHRPPDHCASWGLTGPSREVLGGCDNCGNIIYSEADGHLIAAAPDLYAALDDIASSYIKAGEHGTCERGMCKERGRSSEGVMYELHLHHEQVSALLAALTKARGEATS